MVNEMDIGLSSIFLISLFIFVTEVSINTNPLCNLVVEFYYLAYVFGRSETLSFC